MPRRLQSSVTTSCLLWIALSALPVGAQVIPLPPIHTVQSGSWSSPSTWDIGSPPTYGQEVHIALGHNVTLDIQTPDLALVVVRGQLEFSSSTPITLTASRIEVAGAIKAEALGGGPFTGDLTILLSGTHTVYTDGSVETTPGNFISLENKSFLVYSGAALQLHGKPRHEAWVHLNATVSQYTASLTTDTPVHQTGGGHYAWSPNDSLVLASTDYDSTQAEELIITSIAPDPQGPGSLISFSVPATSNNLLRYNHFGKIENGVDMRAELAHLSRNIRIADSSPWVATPSTGTRGGHIQFLSGANGSPNIDLSWVEFTRMGWYKTVGRYPLHLHLLGGDHDPVLHISHCSIHKCYNRAIAVHGTSDIIIEGNSVYDTHGHAYFLEDGSETGNVFQYNFGCLVREVAGFAGGSANWSNTDEKPAVFWISNPENTYNSNVAAGSQEGYGFWFNFPGDYQLRANPDFSFNSAHSCGLNGIFSDEHWWTQIGQPAQYNNCTAYKCRNSGVWFRQLGESTWFGARISDNRMGMYVASEGFFNERFEFNIQGIGIVPGDAYCQVDSCIIIGESANVGYPSGSNQQAMGRSLPDRWKPNLELKGIEIYDGLIGVTGCIFANFEHKVIPQNSIDRKAGALTARGDPLLFDNTWALDPRNFVHSSTFINCQEVWLYDPGSNSTVHDTVLLDVFGNLTGVANTYVTSRGDHSTPTKPLLDPATGSTVNTTWNALKIPGPGLNFIGNFEAAIDGPNASSTAVMNSQTRVNTNRTLYSPIGPPSNSRKFPCNVLLMDKYDLVFSAPEVDFELALRYSESTRYVIIKIPYNRGTTSNPLGPAKVEFSSAAWTNSPVLGTLDTLPNTEAQSGAGTLYHWSNNELHIKMILQGSAGSVFTGREIKVKVSSQ